MKKTTALLMSPVLILLLSCGGAPETKTTGDEGTVQTQTAGGQENVKDDDSQKDVVKVAVGSPDHKTLVAALKQAELVTSLSNAGPFTVFAPTDAAFSKIDKATLDALMTDANKSQLQDILQYHVTLSAIKAESLQDGQTLGMVNGSNATVSVRDGKVVINGNANIIASVPASNGIVHVIDAVLMPPSK